MEVKYEVCKNPWCKATFAYKEHEMETNDNGDLVPPRICGKCKSFSNELSGGVEWSDKEYEGSRFDGMPHQIRYKVTNFKL
jgi:hypothetical protein